MNITVKNGETWIGWLGFSGQAYTGKVSLWNVNPDLSRGAFQEYGPFGNWRLTGIGAADDGSARLLWQNGNNSASFWVVNKDLSRGPFQEYGPFSGWTPIAISDVNTVGEFCVLWVNGSGAASVWFVNKDLTRGTFKEYGPFTGWSPVSIGLAGDGSMRLLWVSNDNSTVSLWKVNSDLSRGPFQEYGPFPTSGGVWSPVSMSVGVGGDIRLLWRNTANQAASVWVINADLSRGPFQEFGPFSPAAWSPYLIGVDDQGGIRLLWISAPDNGTGISLWLVNSDLTRGPFQEYGQFADWTVGPFPVIQ